MNVLVKSFAAFSLLTGPALLTAPAGAASLVTPAPAQSALNALAARPDSPLPAGTRLLSVRIVDGLATADFSRELRDNFSGGDSGETRTVNAILGTLGKFLTISRVQLLVQGKPVDSLGGLLALADPLPVIRTTSETAIPHRWLHRVPHTAAPAAKTYAL